MAASTNKKVIVLRFDREALCGFVNPQTFLRSDGVELLSPSGSILTIQYEEIKYLCFVREFQTGKPVLRQAFYTRPKAAGLWVRMEFRDGDTLEGLLPNNLLLVEWAGFTVVPPDATGNTQKVFAPRAALEGIQVLGVVGSPLRASRRADRTDQKRQIGLFE